MDESIRLTLFPQTEQAGRLVLPAPAANIDAASSMPSRRMTAIGLACVAGTALGWGLNWPATKYLLTLCPPMSARGVSGLVAGIILLSIAASRGESLTVPRRLRGRLVIAALLNVSAWMGLTTASLLWLPAGQAAILAYTMPVWTTLLAWPVLAERPAPRQTLAIVLGICGVVILLGAAGVSLTTVELPGVIMALSAAALFASGTVWSKRQPIPLPRMALTGWQVLLGCLPLLVVGLLFEHPNFAALPLIGWATLAYTALISMGLCYILWFAAVRRLRASTAAIGTLLTPAIGVVASTLTLGDPLTMVQLVSLGLVAGGVLLAIKN
ncbi:MAG: DMT family transporter [Acidobacteriaceae bacterium]